MKFSASIPQRFEKFLVLFFLFFASGYAVASPATFVTALPVAENQILARFNWNSIYGSQSFTSFQFPINLAYGLNARWTVFASLTPLRSSAVSQTTDGTYRVTSAGWADSSVFARYTLISVDKPGSTLRIAPLAGLYIPTGSNTLRDSTGLLPGFLQTGSGSVDPYGGLALGWNNAVCGFAADSTFRHNPIGRTGVSPGDQFRADGQGEVRLHPLKLPEYGLPHELWLSIEENYQHNSLTHSEGIVSSGSGGSSFYQDAILEYATLHYEVGAGVQIPVMQNLNSPSAEREKREVLVFTEYYFSGFKGRRK